MVIDTRIVYHKSKCLSMKSQPAPHPKQDTQASDKLLLQKFYLLFSILTWFYYNVQQFMDLFPCSISQLQK